MNVKQVVGMLSLLLVTASAAAFVQIHSATDIALTGTVPNLMSMVGLGGQPFDGEHPVTIGYDPKTRRLTGGSFEAYVAGGQGGVQIQLNRAIEMKGSGGESQTLLLKVNGYDLAAGNRIHLSQEQRGMNVPVRFSLVPEAPVISWWGGVQALPPLPPGQYDGSVDITLTPDA